MEEQQPIFIQGEPQPQYYYPPTGQQNNDKADLLEKIKPDVIIETIRHKLLGERYINGDWVKVKALAERSLTEIGAEDLSNLMLAVSSQNVSLSKLTDSEIRMRCMSIAKTAQYMCLKNWKEYGIKGTDQLSFVNEIIFSNTFVTLKQSQDEGIRRMIQGTISEVRSHNTEESSGGILNLFRRKK